MTRDGYLPEELRTAFRHHWFPVARAEDLHRPQPVQLLDERLVAFRDAGGRPRVTARRCIHRGADLSAGRVDDTGLRCPYHGWSFDGSTGECTTIPSLEDGGQIPARARIATYPVMERFGHVWTSLEEPVLDVPGVADIPEIAELDLLWATGRPIPVECGFMAQVENFRDVAHFPHVHQASMGDLDPVVPNLRVRREGREVWGTYHYPEVPGAQFSEAGACDFTFHGYAPGIATILADYGKGGKRFLMDFPCPVSQDRCVIFWAIAVERTFTAGTLEGMRALETQVYEEDTLVINSLDPAEVPLAGEVEEVSSPADAYTLTFRKGTRYAVDEIRRAHLAMPDRSGRSSRAVHHVGQPLSWAIGSASPDERPPSRSPAR
ncbi:MAG TPA: aromatic ring-hydroxylating dioxygenase subunit alpha [Mycobacteriales bacterium]